MPAWATKCLPHKRSDRLGVAVEYIGLSPNAALRLAARQGDNLYPMGFAGHCVRASDDVFRDRRVALVYDKKFLRRWDIPVWKRIPRTARVIAAERVAPTWGRGVQMPNPYEHG
jgi:hypothetical protein